MDKVSLGCFFCTIHLVWIEKLKQPMITIKVMTEIEHIVVFRNDYKQKKW